MIDTVRYVVNEMRRHYDDAHWWRERLESRVIGPAQRALEQGETIDVMEEDWDNLMILDACRADLFEETLDIGRNGEFDSYRRVRSPASATPEWIKRNFAGEKFGDTVYVSGNPWVTREAPESFHEIVNIWLNEYDINPEELREASVLRDVGVEAGASILAEDVTEAAVRAHERHPDKRLIVHYFQPHAPYIGLPGGERKSPEEIDPEVHPGRSLRDGRVDGDEVWRQYRDNLAYVYHHADRCARNIGGKSVFTADHGELFGERLWPFPIRGYAHPMYVRADPVVVVPWAERTYSDRREVNDGGTTTTTVDEGTVSERLRDLGYIE